MRKRIDRAALRRELYERIDRGELGLVEAVRIMRQVAGKTQAQYARLVGISERSLIDFERGVGNPRLSTLKRILAPFRLELTVRRRPSDEGA
jgi:transcriptional regulator with XRE-family HTH domain